MGVGKGWGEEAERYSNSSWILAGVVLEPCLPPAPRMSGHTTGTHPAQVPIMWWVVRPE